MKRILPGILAFIIFITLLPAAPADVYADSTASFVFSEDGITASSSYFDSFINGTALTIRADGVYEITGSCSEGSIVIRDGLSDVVLILRDLTLKSSKTATILVKKNSGITIHTEGTVDLYDDEDPENENSPDKAFSSAFEGAAVKIKKKAGVVFCGDGILNIHGNAKTGISGSSQANVSFSSSDMTYNISSAGNAVSSDGSITVYGGTFSINAEKDGIKSVPDSDDEASDGTVTIYGGTFDIDAGSDGIQAEELTVYNGSFDIKTLTGYDTSGTKYWNRTHGKMTEFIGTFNQRTMSCKGLKASGDRPEKENILNIYGGSFIIDSADDAVHSDNIARITGGTFDIETGDDAVHAEKTLIIGTEGGYERDPEINVYHSYEGMESSHVYFYQGRYCCEAYTDGINASGSLEDSFAVSDDSIEIYGGIIYINSRGDGIDSNGSLTLKGGSAVIYSDGARGVDSPLDANGDMIIDGFTLFGSGSYGVDGPLKPSYFRQPYYEYNRIISENKLMQVINDDQAVFNDIIPKRSSYILYTSPDLTDSDIFIVGGSELDRCKSSDLNHSYGELETVAAPTAAGVGIGRYTCSQCGKESFKTLLYDEHYLCEGHEGTGYMEDSGFEVTFECDEGVDSVEVFYTKDDEIPYFDGLSPVISRDGDTGFPLSDGNGQLNFRINLLRGYSPNEVSATSGSYKNLKQDPDETGDIFRWRMTKIKNDSAVTVTTGIKADLDSDTEIFLLPGDEYQTEAFIGGEKASSENAEYKSSNNSCVFVSSDGIITAKKQGAATVTITPKEGGDAASCTVRVLFNDVPLSHGYYSAVCWAADNNITGGYNDGSGNFGIGDPVTRGQVVQFLWRMAGKPEPEKNTQTFRDVKTGHNYYKAVQWAYEQGITAGYSSGKFGPNNTCKRGQICTFLWRYAGKPAPKKNTQTFKDVPKSHGFYKAVQWASEQKITAGLGDGTFGVDDPCTRGQCVTFLYRFL